MGQYAASIKVHVPFADYATADDATEMTERLSDADIVDLVKGRNQSEEEEGEDPDDYDDDDSISSRGLVSDSTTVADDNSHIYSMCTYNSPKKCMF